MATCEGRNYDSCAAIVSLIRHKARACLGTKKGDPQAALHLFHPIDIELLFYFDLLGLALLFGLFGGCGDDLERERIVLQFHRHLAAMDELSEQ